MCRCSCATFRRNGKLLWNSTTVTLPQWETASQQETQTPAAKRAGTDRLNGQSVLKRLRQLQVDGKQAETNRKDSERNPLTEIADRH